MTEPVGINIVRGIFVCVLVVWLWFGLMRYKSKRKSALLVFWILFVCWGLYGSYMRSKMPFPYADSLLEFVNHTQEASHHYRISLLVIDENKYFEISGPHNILARITIISWGGSGPPSCIFDQKGDLIDLTYDVADAPQSWWEKWGNAQSRHKISFEEALELIHQKSD